MLIMKINMKVDFTLATSLPGVTREDVDGEMTPESIEAAKADVRDSWTQTIQEAGGQINGSEIDFEIVEV